MEKKTEKILNLIEEVIKEGFSVCVEEKTIYYNCHLPESTEIKSIKTLCSEYGFVRQATLID